MAFPPDNRSSYPSAGRQTESSLPRILLVLVAVLGLATYGFSYAADDIGASGWHVRFAALAALCAAFSLLANQKPQTMATAALAAMGFLDALSLVVTSESGWASTAIVVLNGIQAAAAVSAMVLWPKAANQNTASYDAYVDYYNQAVRQYYTQQPSTQQNPLAAQDQSQHRGFGQAVQHARASRSEHTAQYGDYADLGYGTATSPTTEYHRNGPATQAAPGAGMPNIGPAHGAAGLPENPDYSTRPASSP